MKAHGNTFLIHLGPLVYPALETFQVEPDIGLRYFKWFLEGVRLSNLKVSLTIDSILEAISATSDSIYIDPLFYDDAMLREQCVAIFVEELLIFLTRRVGDQSLAINGLDIRMVGDVVRVDVP